MGQVKTLPPTGSPSAFATFRNGQSKVRVAFANWSFTTGIWAMEKITTISAYGAYARSTSGRGSSSSRSSLRAPVRTAARTGSAAGLRACGTAISAPAPARAAPMSASWAET